MAASALTKLADCFDFTADPKLSTYEFYATFTFGPKVTAGVSSADFCAMS